MYMDVLLKRRPAHSPLVPHFDVPIFSSTFELPNQNSVSTVEGRFFVCYILWHVRRLLCHLITNEGP